MALPANAIVFSQAMDPADVVDFSLTLTRGDDGSSLLAADEDVYSYTLIPTPEAIAAGLQLLNSGPYSYELDGLNLHFWLSINPAMVNSSIFAGSGVSLGIELTIVTSSASPSRTYQHTLVVKVAQQ